MVRIRIDRPRTVQGWALLITKVLLIAQAGFVAGVIVYAAGVIVYTVCSRLTGGSF